MNLNLTGARLRTGDKVLIAFREYINAPELGETREALEKQFPGVEFTFVGGVERMLLQPAEKENGGAT